MRSFAAAVLLATYVLVTPARAEVTPVYSEVYYNTGACTVLDCQSATEMDTQDTTIAPLGIVSTSSMVGPGSDRSLSSGSVSASWITPSAGSIGVSTLIDVYTPGGDYYFRVLGLGLYGQVFRYVFSTDGPGELSVNYELLAYSQDVLILDIRLNGAVLARTLSSTGAVSVPLEASTQYSMTITGVTYGGSGGSSNGYILDNAATFDWSVTSTPLSAEEPARAGPVLALQPNPTAHGTRIAFSLTEPASATLQVYDVSGRLVRRLVSESLPSGSYSRYWDGRDDSGVAVGAGLFFLKLTAGSTEETRKIIRTR